MNTTTTFETAKVGDRVWSLTEGWGEITDISDYYGYPLQVLWDGGGSDTFTLSGYSPKILAIQSLFWDEIVFEVPIKPSPDLAVDTKVLVWDFDKRDAARSYFSHFDAYGRICVFTRGLTSWTNKGHTVSYNHWELAE